MQTVPEGGRLREEKRTLRKAIVLKWNLLKNWSFFFFHPPKGGDHEECCSTDAGKNKNVPLSSGYWKWSELVEKCNLDFLTWESPPYDLFFFFLTSPLPITSVIQHTASNMLQMDA